MTKSTNTHVLACRAVRLLGGVSALSLICAAAQAQPLTPSDDTLSSVLNRFASESNVEVMYSADVGSRHVEAEIGLTGDARADLGRILRGTDLRVAEPSPNVFVITTTDMSGTPMQTGAQMQSQGPVVQTAQTAPRPAPTPAPVVEETPATVMADDFDLDAETGVITGQVVDQFSGQPLAGAIVLIEGLGRTESTDTRGFYRFSAAPAGQYSLSVNYLGADFQSQRVSVSSGEETQANFSLTDSVTDQVVVYANRSALQQALNQQRAATNSATVVSSDLMGDFPAETLSEALRRVSGVTFTRDDATGEGERISVRGFNDQAINIQLNGIDLQGTGIDRGIDLSGFLTDNIKQVTIQKSLLPSQEATGSGGLVEIETRSGLDYGERYLNLGAEWQTPFVSGFGDEVELSATGAYQLTPDFGLSATVQYRDSKRTNYNTNALMSFDSVLPAGFANIFRVPESFNFPFDPEIDEPLYTGAAYVSQDRDSENLTMSLNAAYDWNDHTRFRLDLQQIESDAVFSQARTLQNVALAFSPTQMPVPELGGEIRPREYALGLSSSIALTDQSEDLTTRSISFRGETDVDNWEFDYKIGYSDSERARNRSFLSFQNTRSTTQSLIDEYADPNTVIITQDDSPAVPRVVGGFIDFVGDGIPILSLTAAGRDYVDDPSQYALLTASQADTVDTSENTVFELDVRRYFGGSYLDYIEVGGKFEDRVRENGDDNLSTTALQSAFSFGRERRNGQRGNVFLSELNSSAYALSDFSDIGLGVPIGRLNAGSGGPIIDQLFDIYRAEDDPSTEINESRLRLNDRRQLTPQEDALAISPAEIGEKILAAYIEAKVDVSDLEIIGGVRYQREKRNSRLISTPTVFLPGTAVVTIPRIELASVGLVDYIDAESEQELWTPSVIANYRPNEQIVVRGAYFRSTVLPTIALLARPTNFLLDLRTGFERAQISEPNPDLKPTVTDNFDLDLSYYFKDNPGLVRLGLFYKDVANNFTQFSQPLEPTDASIRDRILERLQGLEQIDPALLNIPDVTEYAIRRPINGEGGEIYGAELEVIRQIDFLGERAPSWVENFSVVGNLTYTKSEFSEVEAARNDDGENVTLQLLGPLAGQSEWAGNASLRYEDGHFSGSVIYTYQSASSFSRDEFNINEITPGFDTLDARLAYQFDGKGRMPRMIVYLEGDDLLRGSKDADVRRAFASTFSTSDFDYYYPSSIQYNGGRRVTVGARVTF
ncbi:TonB-dependent receptor [uncultured Algimonas sp.]|uniref:TonB-dependent receptor n=1 Tax=uncultured Algimonas sp. TaxID=1547920 RepID=UPI00261149BA|nr:TonB-dependent receptor [uncultured Algimonas sp.]